MTVKKLIQNPENWTQGWYAKTKEGKKTWPTTENAYAFCLTGAMERVYPKQGIIGNWTKELPPIYNKVLNKIQELFPNKFNTLSRFNDCSSHKEVMMVVEACGI